MHDLFFIMLTAQCVTCNNFNKSKLDNLPTNLTPDQAYSELVNILNQAKQAIINNPNTHLNNLIF